MIRKFEGSLHGSGVAAAPLRSADAILGRLSQSDRAAPAQTHATDSCPAGAFDARHHAQGTAPERESTKQARNTRFDDSAGDAGGYMSIAVGSSLLALINDSDGLDGAAVGTTMRTAIRHVIASGGGDYRDRVFAIQGTTGQPDVEAQPP